MGVNDPELEDHIIQHLAAAAAMGRTQEIDRREDYINLSSVHARPRPQFMVFSSHPNPSSTDNVSASRAPGGSETEPAASMLTNSSVPLTAVGNEGHENVSSSVQSNLISSSSSGHVAPTTRTGISSDLRSFMSRSSLPTQDRAGPSEFQSLSESWKSGLNAISMKYKESISKNTRGWKEKPFSKGSRMADIGSEVRREPNPGIVTVKRLMENLRQEITTDLVVPCYQTTPVVLQSSNEAALIIEMQPTMAIILLLLLLVQRQFEYDCSGICILSQHVILDDDPHLHQICHDCWYFELRKARPGYGCSLIPNYGGRDNNF